MRTLPEVITESGADVLAVAGRIVLVLVLAFVATRLVRRGIRRFVAGLHGEKVQHGIFRLRERTPNALLRTNQTPTVRAAQRAETIGALLRSAATFVIWAIALLTVFGELGINLGPLIAGAGIVGVAVGFGAQNLVRDFLSGIFMLIEDQYGVGDVVNVGAASGTVEGVSLRTTRIRDIEGNVWHVPNGNIQWVANMSQQWARALIDVDVAAASIVDDAVCVIRDVGVGMWNDTAWRVEILEEPEVWGVERLGPDGLTIRLAVKTRPGSQWKVAREVRARLKFAFDDAGIDMAVPRRLVYNADGTGSVTTSGD